MPSKPQAAVAHAVRSAPALTRPGWPCFCLLCDCSCATCRAKTYTSGNSLTRDGDRTTYMHAPCILEGRLTLKKQAVPRVTNKPVLFWGPLLFDQAHGRICCECKAQDGQDGCSSHPHAWRYAHAILQTTECFSPPHCSLSSWQILHQCSLSQERILRIRCNVFIST